MSFAADLHAFGDSDMMDVPAREPLPFMAAALLVLALLPAEMSISPGGLYLSAPRVGLLIFCPILATRMLQSAARPGFHASLSDYLVIPVALWMFLSVSMSQGVQRAIVGSSVMILELVGGYLATRMLPLRPGVAVAFARFAAWAIAFAGLFGPLDTLAGQHITHQVADLLTHYNMPWGLDMRSGLLRAMGTQDHPILLGCVSCFGAVLAMAMLRGAQRILACLGCMAGLFSALSSAPIMATFLAFGLLWYRRCTPTRSMRWWLIGAPIGLLIAVLLTASSNPFGFIFQHFTMDPQTGWYRLLIWQVAGPLVLNSPLFGIGLDDWARESWMPSTVDAVWLRSAMSFGIVGSALIAALVIGSCSRGLRPRGRLLLPPDTQDLGAAVGIIVFLSIYLGFTVHFWGCTWIMLGMFAGLRAHLGALAADQPLLEECEGEDAEPAGLATMLAS